MADVELRNVTKSFGKEIGIDAISLKINNGDLLFYWGQRVRVKQRHCAVLLVWRNPKAVKS